MCSHWAQSWWCSFFFLGTCKLWFAWRTNMKFRCGFAFSHQSLDVQVCLNVNLTLNMEIRVWKCVIHKSRWCSGWSCGRSCGFTTKWNLRSDTELVFYSPTAPSSGVKWPTLSSTTRNLMQSHRFHLNAAGWWGHVSLLFSLVYFVLCCFVWVLEDRNKISLSLLLPERHRHVTTEFIYSLFEHRIKKEKYN